MNRTPVQACNGWLPERSLRLRARIETNGRYWISGDAGSFGFRDTQVSMQEQFRTLRR